MRDKIGGTHMTKAIGRDPRSMRLEVFTNDVSTTDLQRITVVYNPDKEYTSVGCNADIVTISLAINVLQELFDNAAAEMSTVDVAELQIITRKAVGLR